jgi:hypothetical protein
LGGDDVLVGCAHRPQGWIHSSLSAIPIRKTDWFNDSSEYKGASLSGFDLNSQSWRNCLVRIFQVANHTGQYLVRKVLRLLTLSRRVGRTAAQHGVRVTTLYTDPDAQAQHALSSSHAINLGHTSAYLDGERIIEIAKREGCQAIHPGYGFVSHKNLRENPIVNYGVNLTGTA